MNTAYARTLITVTTQPQADQLKLVEARMEALERVWTHLYKAPPALNDYRDDFKIVFKALMCTPMPALRNHTVRELMPYSAGDDARIESAARDLANGDYPAALFPRYAIAAARLAVERMKGQRTQLVENFKTINELTAKLVEENAPKGTLAPDESREHREYVESFADTITIPRR
jgi:hypothetical protein